MIVGLVALFGWAAVEAARRTAQVGELQPALESFLRIPYARVTSPPRLAGRRVVCVSATEKDFDSVEYRLEPGQRADRPDEVAAVVVVWRRQVRVGQYGGNPALGAYRQDADVMVIERSSGRVIAERHFVGKDPPTSVKRGGVGIGPRPIGEVVEWLKLI